MSLTLGELNALVSVDDDGFDRGMTSIQKTFVKTAAEAEKAFSQIPEAARESGEQTGEQFTRGADGKLRDSRGRFVKSGESLGEGAAAGFGFGIGKLASIAKQAGGLLGSIAGPALQLTATLGKAGLAAGGLYTAAQGAAALVAALAPAAGMLAALPAAFLLAKAASATLKVALLGVGEAFGSALGDDAAAFEESLKKLSPAAQSVAREVRAMKPAFDSLKSSVQDSFFAPLKGQLTGVASALMGPVKAGMSGVAGEFGRLATGVTAFGKSSSAVGLVNGVFATLKKELGSISSGTIKDLLAAIAGFVKATLPAFKGLGGGLDGMVKSFTAWLKAATAAGKPLQWIESAKDAFAAIGEVLGNIGGILSGVFKAMETAGGGALGILGQLLEQVNAFFNSAEGQDALVKIFTALGEAGEALWPIFEALAGVLADLAPYIAGIATALGPGITAVVQALGGALVAMAPGLIIVARELSKAFANPVVQAALQKLGQAAGELLAGLAPLIPPIVTLAAELGGALADALLLLTPYLPEMSKAFGELLLALVPLLPPLVELVAAVAPLMPVITDVIKILTWLTKLIVDVVIMAIKGLIMQVKTWVTSFTQGWSDAKAAVQKAIDGVMTAVDWLKELPGKLGGWVTKAKDAAVEKFGQLVDWVKDLPGKIVKGLGNLGKLLVSAGKDLINGLIGGIKDMAGKVVEAAKGVVSDAVSGAKSLLGIASPSKVFHQIGVMTVQGLVNGIRASQETARMSAANLAALVKDAFKVAPDAPDHLTNWVKTNTDALSRLADERERLIKRMADAKAYAGQIAGAAADFASITNIDMEAGSGIGDLVGGLESRLQAIKNFANNIKTLAASGLNKTVLKQIIDAGPEKGGSIAEMLVGASGAEIKAINKAQLQIDKVSKQLGKNSADALYDVGKQAGQGYLKGLQGSLKEVESMMAKIARAVVDAAKKELGIKSPSRVMAGIGGQTMAGWIGGISAQQSAAQTAITDTLAAALKAGSGMRIPIPGVGATSTMPRMAPAMPSSTAPGMIPGSQAGVVVNVHDPVFHEQVDVSRFSADVGFDLLNARGQGA